LLKKAKEAALAREKIKSNVTQDATGEIELYNKRGISLGKEGRIDEAIALFKKAVEIDPSYAESYNNLGYAYYLKGDKAQAEAYFRKTLEMDPANKKASHNLNVMLNEKPALEKK
jgi:superkiller protein 3